MKLRKNESGPSTATFVTDQVLHVASQLTQLNSTLKTDAGAMRLYIRICNRNFYATLIYSNVTL